MLSGEALSGIDTFTGSASLLGGLARDTVRPCCGGVGGGEHDRVGVGVEHEHAVAVGDGALQAGQHRPRLEPVREAQRAAPEPRLAAHLSETRKGVCVLNYQTEISFSRSAQGGATNRES